MSARSTLITGVNRAIAGVDSASQSLLVTDLSGAAATLGDLFVSSNLNTSVANNASLLTLMRVPVDTLVFALVSGRVTGNTVLTLYEAPTTTADGTARVVTSSNRNNPGTSGVLVFDGPTVTANGTFLVESIITGGTQRSSVGGNFAIADAWQLAAGTDYLMDLNNISGSPSAMSLFMSWAEYSNPALVRIG